MKKFLVFSLFFTIFSSAFSRTVNFPIEGLCTVPQIPPQIQCEWDENWFYKTDSFTYSHQIARIACILSEVSYVDVQKNPKSSVLFTIYKNLGISESEIEFHYNVNYEESSGNNQSAISFAKKDNIIFVVIRGTPLSANEWISNLDISDTTRNSVKIHEGFYKSSIYVYEKFSEYLKKHNIDRQKSYFLITGHSRGASIANYLSTKLIDDYDFDSKRIFTYTFAAANLSTESNTQDPRYGFIWNIVNAEDIIPSEPPNFGTWNFRKYGNTKILVNAWNSDYKKYKNDFLPRVNEFYRKFLLRNYHPFKMGSYFPVQIARILTDFYPTVEDYYKNFINLRDTGEYVITKIFPKNQDNSEDSEFNAQETSEQKIEHKSKTSFLDKMLKLATNRNIEDFEEVFTDMHACEAYLSFMLALDESEAFAENSSTQIILEGDFEMAIFDENQNCISKLFDGSANFKSLVTPTPVITFFRTTIAGFPSNRNFSVLIYKDSLIPVPIKVRMEHYNAQGHLIDSSENETVWVGKFTAAKFDAGKISLEQTKPDFQEIKGTEKKDLVKAGNISRQNLNFSVDFSLEFNRNLNPELGMNLGNRMIYGKLLAEKELSHFVLKTGLGHEETVFSRIILNTDLLAKFIFNDEFSIEPETRISIAFKPWHRLQFFAAEIFDFDCQQKKLKPNLRLGIKF